MVGAKEKVGGGIVFNGGILSVGVAEMVVGVVSLIKGMVCAVSSGVALGGACSGASNVGFPKEVKLNVGFGGIVEVDEGRIGVTFPLGAAKGSTAAVDWVSGSYAPSFAKSKAASPLIPYEPIVVVFKVAKSNFDGATPFDVGRLGFPKVEFSVLVSDTLKMNGEEASAGFREGVV